MCVCARHAAYLLHTQGKTASHMQLLSTMPENISQFAGPSQMRTRAVLSSFVFFVFFKKRFMDVCTIRTKINIVSIRL